MRHYEMMVIFTDLLDEEQVQERIERTETFVADQGGTLLSTDYWGKREFAYEINHRTHGYYAVFDFELEGPALHELERQLRLDDGVVRFKTIRPDLRVRNPGSQRATKAPV